FIGASNACHMTSSRARTLDPCRPSATSVPAAWARLAQVRCQKKRIRHLSTPPGDVAGDGVVDGQPHGAHAAVLVEALGVDEPLVPADEPQLVEQVAVGSLGLGQPGIDQEAVAGNRLLEADLALFCQPALGACLV